MAIPLFLVTALFAVAAARASNRSPIHEHTTAKVVMGGVVNGALFLAAHIAFPWFLTPKSHGDVWLIFACVFVGTGLNYATRARATNS